MLVLCPAFISFNCFFFTALLRDLEQPEILVKLIQILAAANYDFQLVYNSSQLNVWGVKTLALAGLVERQLVLDSGKCNNSFYWVVVSVTVVSIG